MCLHSMLYLNLVMISRFLHLVNLNDGTWEVIKEICEPLYSHKQQFGDPYLQFN